MFAPAPYVPLAAIPGRWMIETYLGLGDQLQGQTIRIDSPFNPLSTHKVPLSLYYSPEARDYRFKCWSTGQGGAVPGLLAKLWQVDYAQAGHRIERDYGQFLLSGQRVEPLVSITPHRWKVVHTFARSWNTNDAQFWPRYNVSSALLEADFVRPLAGYVMQKFVGETPEPGAYFEVHDNHLYGYHTPAPNPVLYKLYQPFCRERKYLKVENVDYVQGEGSLRNHPYLGISAGMKDMLALKSLKLNVDWLAPDSENNLLSRSFLEAKLTAHPYQGVFSLLDLDQCGLDNMRRYQSEYGIPACPLWLGHSIPLDQKKDAALCVKNFGTTRLTAYLTPAIERASHQFHGLQSAP